MFVLTQASRRGRHETPAEQRDRRRRLAAAGTRVLGGKTSQQVRLRYRLKKKTKQIQGELFQFIAEFNRKPRLNALTTCERRLVRNVQYLQRHWSKLSDSEQQMLQQVRPCKSVTCGKNVLAE